MGNREERTVGGWVLPSVLPEEMNIVDNTAILVVTIISAIQATLVTIANITIITATVVITPIFVILPVITTVTAISTTDAIITIVIITSPSLTPLPFPQVLDFMACKNFQILWSVKPSRKEYEMEFRISEHC